MRKTEDVKREFKIYVQGGSLCFYGDWFGRPGDNYHQIKGYTYQNDVLEIYFDEGEILRISNPKNIVNEKEQFAVTHAMKVEWIHHLYGNKVNENDRVDCYEAIDGQVVKTTKYGTRKLVCKDPYYAVMLG